MPQFFKDNLPYVQLCIEHLTATTALQYQQEERSSIVQRVRSERHRIAALRDVSSTEELSTEEHVKQLREGYADYYKNDQYLNCRTMTDIIEMNVKNVIRQVKL